MFVVRDPVNVKLVSDRVVRLNRALQDARVSNIKMKVLLFEQPARFDRLLDALVGQRHIVPAGEPVLLVPGRLSMANEHDLVDAFSIVIVILRVIRGDVILLKSHLQALFDLFPVYNIPDRAVLRRHVLATIHFGVEKLWPAVQFECE